MKDSDWDKVRNFEKKEWGAMPERNAPGLVYALDEIRNAAGVAVYIIDAFATNGHAEYSYHYTGLACDFYFEMDSLTPIEQFLIISQFKIIGAIGWYPVHYHKNWHIDLRFGDRRTYWLYDGTYHYGWRDLASGLFEKR